MVGISTNNLYNQTIGNALGVQTQLATTLGQESSGLQAQDFGTLGGSQSGETLNLETNIAQSQNWATVAKAVSSTTQAMYTAVGNMSTASASLEALISNAISSPNNTSLLSQAQSIQQELLSQVNQQVGGNYLFAGTNTSEAPVNMSNYPTLSASTNAYDPNTADTSYYTGNDVVQSVQVNLQQTVHYGVTADNSAIEAAMRAVQTVIAAAQVSANSTNTATSATAATNFGGTLQVNNTTFTIGSNQSLTQIAASIDSQAAGTGITAKVVADTSGAYHLQLSNGQNAMTITDNAGLGLSSVSPLPQTQLVSSLQQALTSANSAVTGLSNLQQNISNSSSELEQATTQQTTFVTYLTNSLSSVKDVDSGQAASQAQHYQAQLQASYLAISSLSKMNLAQYL